MTASFTDGFASSDSRLREGGRAFVAGVRAELALDDVEAAALPHLAAGRLATSFTLGWFSYQESLVENPDMPQARRDYMLHHALPAADALACLLDDPDFLRHGAGAAA